MWLYLFPQQLRSVHQDLNLLPHRLAPTLYGNVGVHGDEAVLGRECGIAEQHQTFQLALVRVAHATEKCGVAEVARHGERLDERPRFRAVPSCATI